MVLPESHPLTPLKITNLRLTAIVIGRAAKRPMDKMLDPISISINEFNLLERAQLESDKPLNLSVFIDPVRSTSAPDTSTSSGKKLLSKHR